MKKEIYIYDSSDKTSKISSLIYTPEEGAPVVGVLQIVHGMCEYMERYESMAEYFCARGWVVCGNDHLGHRDTALLNHATLGYFGKKGSWQFLVEDVDTLRREMARRYPGLPYYLFGHSMGSFVTRLYVVRYGSGLAGYIMSGTAGKNPVVGLGKLMAGADVALHGDKHISNTINNMAVGGYGKAIPGAKTPVDWLCHDEAVCRKYLADPYCTFIFTSSAYREMMEMIDRCNRGDWYRDYPKDLRTFIVAGATDPVGSAGKGPQEVCDGLKAAGVKDVTLHLWPNGRHEMHNEFEKEKVFEEYLKFMKV